MNLFCNKDTYSWWVLLAPHPTQKLENHPLSAVCDYLFDIFGIATGYGLDGPGIESRWGRDFLHTSRPALGPPSLLYNGYRVFPGGKAAGAWC
jgi:hypothetical protein